MVLQDIVITGIKNIQTVSRVKGKNQQINHRTSHGISFCISGQITYFHNGKEYVSTPGNAVYLPMGATYHSQTDRAGLFPLINFNCENPPSDTIMVIPLQSPETYLADFESLKKSFLLPHNKLLSMELFYGILEKLSSESHASQIALAPVIRFLEDNLHNSKLSNAMLADQLSFSEVYFRKLFREVYGCPPHRYILGLRIRKAKQLLADGILSISAIAEECGFSSVYHFSRSFKQLTGASPSDYSRQNQHGKL